ncbi:MAG: NADH-quinone oxidoreductase subunit N [Actinomycetota bacterium]
MIGPEVAWGVLLPALGPAVGAVLVLVADSTLGRMRAVPIFVAGAALVIGLVAVVVSWGEARATFCADADLCGYASSPFTSTLQVLVLAAAGVCLLLNVSNSLTAGPESIMMMLTVVAGACVVAAARDWATLLIGVELASLPLVGLVAIDRTHRAAEAATKLLLTVVSSFGVAVLGVVLLYAATGSLAVDAPVRDPELTGVYGVGVAVLLAGLAFKVSAVPFHFWTPDTYAGAPFPVAALMSTVSKVAGVAAIVLVLVVEAPDLADAWAPAVGLVAAVTMTMGNLVAMRQQVAVRFLAWSTIAQAGWVLLPLAGASNAGDARTGELVTVAAASLGYLVALVPASLAVFAVVTQHGQTHHDGAGHELASYAGWWRHHRLSAAVLAFGVVCLAGFPPGVVGVVAKVVALRPVVDAGQWWLVAVAAGNVVLGLAVYLRWLIPLFSMSSAKSSAKPSPSGGSSSVHESVLDTLVPADQSGPPLSAAPPMALAAGWVAVVATGVACVVLSVWPEPVAGVSGVTGLR